MSRQTKVRCSNVTCLAIIHKDDAKFVAEVIDGHEVANIYCPICYNSEAVKQRDINRNERSE